ncbi:hypothetical protein [Mesorhizobium sp. M00.F.Ca.ET.217.01.1.1]|uniref:hypothetical protein n=1 Tax=Mesorhizobium sp. M00.F.Ca.ET.217.01.1.1 TaxID=2500529 RepID=UPI000FD84ABE|nr:hypothetical protein [Mesorhizobium sp. M00.F.Ca.ET.217.01.1.1]TGQ19272.1 hypothetical protein EN860_019255 [Mesorhizobium sp. M00.F.Ca.ET.217.01.1.1]
MTKHTYEYTFDKEEERYEFDSNFVPDSHWVFEDAAEDFYHNHDGWECGWPIRFDVYHGDRWLGTKEVHMEMEPRFRAFDILEAA